MRFCTITIGKVTSMELVGLCLHRSSHKDTELLMFAFVMQPNLAMVVVFWLPAMYNLFTRITPLLWYLWRCKFLLPQPWARNVKCLWTATSRWKARCRPWADPSSSSAPNAPRSVSPAPIYSPTRTSSSSLTSWSRPDLCCKYVYVL